MRILVIDDDPDILEVISLFMSQATHHEIECASSAKAALDAIGLAAGPFECFLVDIQMPDVDGITLTRLIRQTPGYLNTPIVMLTAMRDKGHLDEAYSAGATDYVSKPFDFADLKLRLQSVQKLTREKCLHQERPLMEGELKGMGGEPKKLRLSDPFALSGVDGAIDYREFENYAFQVRRHRQLGLFAIGVKITHIGHLYAESTSDAFKSVVTDAAKVIQETLLQGGGVLSYRGNGVFICIVTRRLRKRQRTVQKQLNTRFETQHPTIGKSAPGLLAGDHVPIGVASNTEVLSALALAVEDVESKDDASINIFDLPRRYLKPYRLNSEQERLERRACESLLKSSPIESGCDKWSNILKRREMELRGSET